MRRPWTIPPSKELPSVACNIGLEYVPRAYRRVQRSVRRLIEVDEPLELSGCTYLQVVAKEFGFQEIEDQYRV